MASTNGAVTELVPNDSAEVAERKVRGPNKAKAKEFDVTQEGDTFTLSVGGVEIPLDDLDIIKGVIWKSVLKGGTTSVTFTNLTDAQAE